MTCSWQNTGGNRMSESNPITLTITATTTVCTSATWTDGTNIDKNLFVKDSNLKVFTFIPPTLTGTNCFIGSYTLINV